jgi:DNA-binding transcriptional ArsR family regulator
MPYRLLAANALGEFLNAIAHPRRIQIIEELRSGEVDVASLTKTLGVSYSNVSQHLAVLRAHRVIVDRREGRRVFYRLRNVELAEWLVRGMDYLSSVDQQTGDVRKAIRKARTQWSG